jgi:hypothetical protein
VGELNQMGSVRNSVNVAQCDANVMPCIVSVVLRKINATVYIMNAMRRRANVVLHNANATRYIASGSADNRIAMLSIGSVASSRSGMKKTCEILPFKKSSSFNR